MARSYVANYKQVAKHRVVQDRFRYPETIATQIIVTDGGPWASHNVACYVCGDNQAILDLNKGVFKPCDQCTHNGWSLVLSRTRNYWWQFWRRRDTDYRRRMEGHPGVPELSG